MLFYRKPGIVNVKMIITEEKILSNIDKVQKMINPNSKKQIVELEDDAYFKDLIDSIKSYINEYPKKKNFPASVYRAARSLVEYATNQFEDNTKQIEKLIREREQNISKANELKEILYMTENNDKEWKSRVKQISSAISEDATEALIVIGKTKKKEGENYESAKKLIHAKISNLEANLHIEIDMERIEDRSKALSYIGIEIAEALKGVPAPMEEPAKVKEEPEIIHDEYIEQTRFEVKPSLWERIKNSKLIRTIVYVCKIRVVLDKPALPEGRGEKN